MSAVPQKNGSPTMRGMTPLQRELVFAKTYLEGARAALSDREWATLRACLLIYLKTDEEREREVA